MQCTIRPAPRTLVLAISEEQPLLRALASLELARVHLQLLDLMEEDQLLRPVLAKECLNLLSMQATCIRKKSTPGLKSLQRWDLNLGNVQTADAPWSVGRVDARME